jgi:hypothetical protein
VQHRLCLFEAGHAGVEHWPEDFRKKAQGGPVLAAEQISKALVQRKAKVTAFIWYWLTTEALVSAPTAAGVAIRGSERGERRPRQREEGTECRCPLPGGEQGVT